MNCQKEEQDTTGSSQPGQLPCSDLVWHAATEASKCHHNSNHRVWSIAPHRRGGREHISIYFTTDFKQEITAQFHLQIEQADGLPHPEAQSQAKKELNVYVAETWKTEIRPLATVGIYADIFHMHFRVFISTTLIATDGWQVPSFSSLGRPVHLKLFLYETAFVLVKHFPLTTAVQRTRCMFLLLYRYST